jgi:hypothetical protein
MAVSGSLAPPITTLMRPETAGNYACAAGMGQITMFHL